MSDQNVEQFLDRVIARAGPELKPELDSLKRRVQNVLTENESLRDENEALQTELEKTTQGTLQLASELEERYQRLFETAVEGIYTTTAALDRYVMANPAFADLLGYNSGEELCNAVASIEKDVFVDADRYATYSETLASVGEIDQFEYQVRTADGEVRWVSDSATALYDDEGSLDSYRGGIIDITERKRREQDLNRQQQLNAVLRRVFRHNLRNELTVIRGHMNLITDHLDEDSTEVDAINSSIDHILNLANKSQALTNMFTEGGERMSIDVMTAIRQTSSDLRGDYPEASIEVNGPDEAIISAFPNFKEVVIELLENAVKHAGDAPTVTVSVETSPETVDIQVSDDGPGLPEQERKAFETGNEKPLSHGQGLGLWMTYWIVTGHDGTIDTTVSDEGTTITISLPRSTAAQSHNTPVEPASIDQPLGDLFQAAFEKIRWDRDY